MPGQLSSEGVPRYENICPSVSSSVGALNLPSWV